MNLKWFGPGVTADGGSWSNISQSTCFISDLQIAGTSITNYLGDWHVEVYLNGTTIVNIPFHIGPVEPRGGVYTGSFDAVDCSHIYGWAKDSNNPNTTTSVDISVDGTVWATIAAGDYRFDLANAGIGNHAFNEYYLPSNLKDGNQHSVRVVYSGTTTDLPSSPQNFRNTCGITPPTSSIRTGHVVTLPNSTTSTVYYVHPTGLYGFPSADVFYSWGFQFSDVTTANSAEAALPIQTIVIPAKIPGC